MRPYVHTAIAAAIMLAAATAVAAPAPAADASPFDTAAFAPDTSGQRAPMRASGRETERPELRAHHVDDGSVRLDGRLDEPIWGEAELGWGFVMHEPDRGGLPSETTTFKVVYDDEAVYFGVACFERDPSAVSSALARRDNVRNSDVVSIYVDPYHDRTSGYNFRVNPHGVLADCTIANEYQRDWNWDAVWDAAVHRDDRGWFVEVRIPFSALRYQPGDGRSWGLQVYRWMHGRGEDQGWTVWDREASGFVSRWGTLTGLDGLTASRQLEITPYAVGRITDPSEPGPDGFEGRRNMGVDVKYGVTANMTLNATVQPDFGQVEADPSVLNLSPFETFFDEKRPFFIEGSRFFQHNGFNLFYSRRIGTGHEDARIRYAAKLIGKTAGDLSVAALVAETDIADGGDAWNPLKKGRNRSRFGIVRLGAESEDGTRSFHLMQTAVLRDAEAWRDGDSLRDHRDALGSGVDFDLDFADRTWNVNGSFVRTHVDPHDRLADLDDPTIPLEDKIGTAGRLSASKRGGDLRGGMNGYWEHDRFDPNDAGRLSAPDEVVANAWAEWVFDSDGEDSWYRQGNVHGRLVRSWLYAAGRGVHSDDPLQELWSYGARHDEDRGGNVGVNLQLRSYWKIWGGFWKHGKGYSKYATRSYGGQRGPLLERAGRHGLWFGVNSDWRRDMNANVNINLSRTDVGGRRFTSNLSLHWVQSDQLTHDISFGYADARDDAQWIDNVASDTGIGGVGYLFARLDRRTWDVTWRTSALFDRNRSLELYVQPFLTVGDYDDARELAAPASYEFNDYAADGFDVRDRDFSYAAVNLNLVYRWEYRPGSTFFLVWQHSRGVYDERGQFLQGGDAWSAYDNGFDTGHFFSTEPTNVLLTKVTYWFSP